MQELRIGQGVDLHRLVKGRKCVLGGVEIASEVGPEGHSDADVVLHALMDALLGAIGESDIGTHFPNTDEQWKGASSLVLLDQVWKIVSTAGWKLVNADISVVAEHPKLKSHIPEMKAVVASHLHTSPERIGIKATTAEKLGAIGRGEGISSLAVVLLERAYKL